MVVSLQACSGMFPEGQSISLAIWLQNEMVVTFFFFFKKNQSFQSLTTVTVFSTREKLRTWVLPPSEICLAHQDIFLKTSKYF